LKKNLDQINILFPPNYETFESGLHPAFGAEIHISIWPNHKSRDFLAAIILFVNYQKTYLNLRGNIIQAIKFILIHFLKINNTKTFKINF
jgi:hypothetical protein